MVGSHSTLSQEHLGSSRSKKQEQRNNHLLGPSPLYDITLVILFRTDMFEAPLVTLHSDDKGFLPPLELKSA